MNTKKITLTGIFTALSLISFMIESLFPPFIIPGARMGISNVFILLTLIYCGSGYSYFALVLKCVLGNLIGGNLFAVIYSLPSGLIAFTVEALLIKDKNLSVLAVSTLGGVLNLILQNLTFCLLTDFWDYLIYIPYFGLIGILSGLTVGIAVTLIISIIKRINTKTEEKIERN